MPIKQYDSPIRSVLVSQYTMPDHEFKIWRDTDKYDNAFFVVRDGYGREVTRFPVGSVRTPTIGG